MNRASGLSLLEVLVSLAVSSVVFLALALSQLTGFRTTRGAQEAASARDLASRQIEVIRSYGYAVYAERGAASGAFAGCPGSSPAGSSADVDAAFPNCAGSDDSVAGFPGYTVSWTVAPAGGVRLTDPPALYGVDVTVTKDDLTYALASYLSCADAGELSVTGIVCPDESLLP